jgi:hypothetical protein
MFSFLKNKPFLKKAAILTFALFLSAGLMFVSCADKSDAASIVGNWASAYNEGYRITSSTIDHWGDASDYGPASSTKGDISENVTFTSNSGVLIVKVTSDVSQYHNIPAGKFIGVYYKEVTASHAMIADAIDPSSYAPIVKDTLVDAKATFNVGNVGTHVTMWGSGYDRKN